MKTFISLSLLPILLVSFLVSSELDRLQGDIKNLYDGVSPSIVTVHYGTDGEDDYEGTGVVIDGKGHIVTIKRFINDDTIWVETDKSKKMGAKLVGSDSESGITVIKVDSKLKPVDIAYREDVNPGDLLFVIGNSFGITNGISLGIFSGKREEDGFLQIGNAILPGNAGAGVFNTEGKLVGIVSFALQSALFDDLRNVQSKMEKQLQIKIGKGAQIASGKGASLVIPCERMMELAEELITHGRIERGWLGVFIKEAEGNITVTGVVEKGPAEKAGIKENDIILKYDGKQPENLHNFIKMVKDTKPGKKVNIVVERDNKKINLEPKIEIRRDDSKIFRLRKIIPDIEFNFDKDEMNELKEELEEMKKELEKLKNDLEQGN
jgi:S1-C subfamily serine protease